MFCVEFNKVFLLLGAPLPGSRVVEIDKYKSGAALAEYHPDERSFLAGSTYHYHAAHQSSRHSAFSNKIVPFSMISCLLMSEIICLLTASSGLYLSNAHICYTLEKVMTYSSKATITFFFLIELVLCGNQPSISSDLESYHRTLAIHW